jgi:hypothetical protein
MVLDIAILYKCPHNDILNWWREAKNFNPAQIKRGFLFSSLHSHKSVLIGWGCRDLNYLCTQSAA